MICYYFVLATKSCSFTPSLDMDPTAIDLNMFSFHVSIVFICFNPLSIYISVVYMKMNQTLQNVKYLEICNSDQLDFSLLLSISMVLQISNFLMRMGRGLFECCFTSSSSDTFSKQSKWRILPYKKLAKVTNNFNQSHCLGKRGFATEYYGKRLSCILLYEQCKQRRKKLR